MKKNVRITESELKSMVRLVINEISGSGNNIYGPLYHCGDPISGEKFKDVIWFSNKPLTRFGKPHRYLLKMENPLIVPPVFANWCEKLLGYCCDENGNPNKDINDPQLTSILPSFIWDIVQKSDEELEIGDVPYIVADLHKQGKVGYDGVIMKGIGETEAGNIEVDDYCVFSPGQVKEI